MRQFYKSQLFLCILLGLFWGKALAQNPETFLIPAAEEIGLSGGRVCIENLSFYTEEPQLAKLREVLDGELFTMTGHRILEGAANKAELTVSIDTTLSEEAYEIKIDNSIHLKGGSYDAVAMASVSLLQLLDPEEGRLCWEKGLIRDSPDYGFRGLLIDLARRKHDLATIKRVVMLCRWYKINYLQLHLTDEHAFTFPSRAYPQLPTKGWVYSEAELRELVEFSEARGVELIPELEVPGHAGQLVKMMPEVFGFEDPDIHPYTIHMGRDRVYPVLDTLIGEIAEVFHSSEYIHIGGDEARFEGMEADPEIREFLREKQLDNMEELYWYFLNQMNASVKKAGKKTIVWEGFSKEGNEVVSKDITVMAWESLYQLPQDILEAGYQTINVSWKPLYVVNQRKWSPETIYGWNLFRWENWVPSIPSYEPIQLEPHPGMLGAAMASWDQPAYTELSSLRKRLPAMVEEAWNHSDKLPLANFMERLEVLDQKLSSYLSPVNLDIKGLTFPDVEDGHKDEQTWFDNKVSVRLSTERDLEIRYSLDGTPVVPTSPVYSKALDIDRTTELRYRAFSNGNPVGAEMLEFFQLRPLKVEMEGDFSIPLDELWDTTHPNLIRFGSRVQVQLSANRTGTIRYVIGEEELTAASAPYTAPMDISRDAVVKAGLFVNNELVGESWEQRFSKD